MTPTTMTEFCPVCGEDRPIRRERQQIEYTVRGERVSVGVAVRICDVCHTVEAEAVEGNNPIENAYAVYRERHHLLKPEQIRAIRKRYHLSQKLFAALLGMSEATINRYEGGGIQDAAHDGAIRACDSPEHVRNLLESRGEKLTERQRRNVESAIERKMSGRQSGILEDHSHPSERISVETGFRKMDFERYSAAVLWFCRNMKVVTATSLNKLLFYADFLCYKMESRSLTGAAYRRMPYGPVPENYGDLRRWMELQEYVIVQEVAYQNGNVGEEFKVGPKANALRVDFSPQEQQVLQKVVETFVQLTPSELSERSHRESAWVKTPTQKLISYSEASNLQLSLTDKPPPGCQSCAPLC